MTDLSVEVVQTSSLGDRSYLAHDGEVAIVVDPQRDIDRLLALAGSLGVRITHVAETHLHNDYVSGGLALARLTGATYLVAADDEVDFERRPVTDGDTITVSERMRLRVVGTPGHTFHHLSYVLDGDDGPVGVFTGGSLLFGTTGRTDLLGKQHAHTLAERQYASAHRLADLLPDGAQVWPTHGFGSFCSATQSDAPESTIGRERTANPALRLEADDFVKQTLAGLDAYPAYYAHMGARNTAGADLVDLTPVAVADPAALAQRIADGEWVVDLRARKAFAHRHLTGTLSFGLDGPMSTWLGWMAPWGAPITLLGDSEQQVADAQRELARIGIDRPAAAATAARAVGRRRRLPTVHPHHGVLRRPRRRPRRQLRPARRRRGARRTHDERMAYRAHRRRDPHPAARPATPARRRTGRHGVGALRLRLPGSDRQQPAATSRPRGRAHRRLLRRRR